METSFQIEFENGATARAVIVSDFAELADVLKALGLGKPQPAIVVVGGAGGMNSAKLEQIRSLFIENVAKVAEELEAAIIDGGTDSGVMRLAGEARSKIQGRFPLIGVAAIGTVKLNSAHPLAKEVTPLEPHHTHFVLVPGSNWGNESAWIARVASEITGSDFSSVTILINGGEIAWQDVSHSLAANRPVIVLEGSGRTADLIAAVQRGEIEADERAKSIKNSPLLRIIGIQNNEPTLAAIIKGKLE